MNVLQCDRCAYRQPKSVIDAVADRKGWTQVTARTDSVKNCTIDCDLCPMCSRSHAEWIKTQVSPVA